MKTVTKFLALLLALSLLCGGMSIGLTVSAEEVPEQSPIAGENIDTSLPSETYELPVQVNPLYEGILDGDEFALPGRSGSAGDAAPMATGVYLTADEAVAVVRDSMVNRKESFTVQIQSASTDRNGIIGAIFAEAMAHTGNGKEGDSLLWQFYAWGGTVKRDKYVSGINYYTYALEVVYYTDTAQEAELDTAVSNVLSQLALDGKSDYEKICAVYDYVCSNVRYDAEHVEDETYLLQYTSYAALVNKTAVCQGYSLLVYRLLLELGVDCRVICGDAAGGGHAWNIVELDGLWYNLDATWDAGAEEYSWFLKNTWNFSGHSRYLEYETMAFHREYPMAAEDYAEGTVAEMDPIIYAGYCGDTAYWLLDRYGDLVIFGEGATWDFGNDVETMPDWKYWWADDVVTVVVEEGITYLGDHAFSGMAFVTQATLPAGLEAIGDYAFESCKGLTSVELPADLTAMGSYAFSNCTALTGIVIPDGVTTIDAYTFYNCSALKSAALPANLTQIQSNAFRYCSSLTEIALPEGTTSVGICAFESCRSLSKLTLPESLVTIGDHAFSSCSNLPSLVIPENTVDIGIYAFSSCNALASVTLPESMTAIPEGAFKNCTWLNGLTLPENLTSIGSLAFASCISLDSVEIPGSVTFIGDGAFRDCYKLATAVLEEGITSTGSFTFHSCRALAEVELPGTLTSIGSYAFYGCSALESITFPENLTTIREKAFATAGLKTVEVPASVTTLENGAFYNCDALETAVLNNTGSIGESMFGYSWNLKEVVISGNVTAIESDAFKNCSALAVIHFLGDPPRFADVIFSGVTATAYYPGDNTAWTSDVMQDYGGDITWAVHEHVSDSVVTAPTCTEQGYTTYTCTECGKSYVDDYVDALGHSCSEYELTLVPTGFKTGKLTGTCSVCSATVTVELPALNSRDYAIEVTLEPTETETGTAIYTWNNTGYGIVSFEVTLRSLSDKILLGDVNGDGNINILDANLAASYYNEVIDLSDDQLLAADVNGDGIVNILDANLIAAYYNEVIEAFPAA